MLLAAFNLMDVPHNSKIKMWKISKTHMQMYVYKKFMVA
jgi:hypothetical protein